MSQRQDRRARRKADAPATRQSSRRQRPDGKWIQPGGGNRCGRQQERPPNGKAGRPTEKQTGSPKNRPAGDDPAATKNREMQPGGCISPFYVIPERFERSTRSLEGCCSIQLSYGTIGAQGPKAPFADAKVGKIFHFRVLSAVSWMKTCPFSPNYFAARIFLSTFAGLKARRG